MRVAMISDNETSGGAAVAASRLAHGLYESGVHVHRIFKISGNPPSMCSRRRVLQVGARAARVARLVNRYCGGRLSEKVEQISIARGLAEKLLKVRPDVINVHNLHGARWHPDLVALCCDTAPVVWTLHDMWSFTGRCAYSYDCERYRDGCDSRCPTPTEYPALEPQRIAPAWRSRQRLLAHHPDIVAVTPSHWLAHAASTGLWREHRVEVVPYGLSLDVFRPIDRAVARKKLGLPTGAPILLVVAEDLVVRRKGMNYLLEALKLVRQRPLHIVAMGNGTLPINDESICVHSVGFVGDSHQQSLAYSAADILVHPAPVDNLPIVVTESIACGTPCVAFPIGGLPEMVRPGVTGWMAKELSSQALAAAIDQSLTDIASGVDLRAACRQVAEEHFSLGLQTRRYIQLFQDIQ